MTTPGSPLFEWHACDDEVVVRDEEGRPFTATRIATVTIAAGEGASTRWEVIGTGEDFVVLETRFEGGATTARYWGLPPWRAYADALLATCTSLDEVRAWLGVGVVEPVEGDRWCGHFEAVEQAREDERRMEEAEAREAEEWDERGMPDAGENGAKPSGPFRPVPLGELPEATLAALEGALVALARELPLDVTGCEVVAASARQFDVYDRGVDIFGGVDWRVAAAVGWGGRPALVVGSFSADDASDPEPASMRLTLIAPASRDRAEQIARGDELEGLDLPAAQLVPEHAIR